MAGGGEVGNEQLSMRHTVHIILIIFTLCIPITDIFKSVLFGHIGILKSQLFLITITVGFGELA